MGGQRWIGSTPKRSTWWRVATQLSCLRPDDQRQCAALRACACATAELHFGMNSSKSHCTSNTALWVRKKQLCTKATLTYKTLKNGEKPCEADCIYAYSIEETALCRNCSSSVLIFLLCAGVWANASAGWHAPIDKSVLRRYHTANMFFLQPL